MSNNPGDTPDDPEDRGQNPFKGTPFEQFFGSAGLGGTLAGGPGGMPDLGALFSQIQSLMQPYDGALNWDYALDTARKLVAQQPDPSPSQKQKDAVADALRLADHWLDDTTTFPSGISSTAAWSRAEWIVGTTDVWKVLVEPIAEGSVQALGSALPEEARAASGPMLGILGKAVGAMLASQVGSGLGGLAAEGLDVSEDDVLLFLALREAAHQRLFAHVPWLREHLIGAVADYARGMEINAEGIQSRIEEQMRGIDPTNPESMQQLLEGGMFDLPQSPAQTSAL